MEHYLQGFYNLLKIQPNIGKEKKVLNKLL